MVRTSGAMSGGLYARYIPPSASSTPASPGKAPNGQKRKQEEATIGRGADKKRKKHKKDDAPAVTNYDRNAQKSAGLTVPKSINNESADRVSNTAQDGQRTTSIAQNDNVLTKYSITKFAQSNGTDATVRSKQSQLQGGNAQDGTTKQKPHSEASAQIETAQIKKKKRKEKHESNDGNGREEEDFSIDPMEVDQSVEMIGEDGTMSKHSSILSKFQRSRDTASKASKRVGDDGDVDPEDLHGLEPIPQPLSTSPMLSKPTYTTLPPWLARPTYVSALDKTEFAGLGVDSQILQNLQSQGMREAFSVQASVIPLLLSGAHRYNGDVCISAATGSGKTLAYVLPMIQSLKGYVTTRLRGLVVVPTRELVKQAREVCELCAAGTGLKIATAVGSKSLDEEEEVLIEEYDEYIKSNDTASGSMTLNNWENFDLRSLFEESKQNRISSFRAAYRSKIDILICTPGRLVDHLRSTQGFHLGHLEWLVVDEADRLLNESFQEWVETVMPALQKESADDEKLSNELLRSMRMQPPARVIQKIILTATFSTDISKLNSLQLRNPKLVIVGDKHTFEGGEFGQNEQDNTLLSLPPTLEEYMVPVGDGSEKPLYLLNLLRTKLSKKTKQSQTIDADQFSSTTSDSTDSSSTGSSSESETDSDTSESDSDSDTSAATSSLSTPTASPSSTTPKTLIFTSSTQSAHRLSRLLSLLSPTLTSRIRTLTKTSSSSNTSTRHAFSLLRANKISILIATDRASRGLDIKDLDHVVSYDVPNSVTSYVHRVGRTARAARRGTAWTLVAHREGRWFWSEIGGKSVRGKKGIREDGRTTVDDGGEDGLEEEGKIARNRKAIKKIHVELAGGEKERQLYDDALKTLGEEVRGGPTGRTT